MLPNLQSRNEVFKSKVVLEIGSGVGLLAIIGSLSGVRKMIATDLDHALSLTTKNLVRNLNGDVDNFEVMSLDVTNFQDANKFSDVDVIIGADVIYDFDVTDGIVNVVKKVACLQPFKPKTFLFSVEKRFIFSVESLDTVAPAFDYFVTLLEDLKSDLSVKHNIALSVDYLTLSSINQAFCYERSKDLSVIELKTYLTL